MTDLPAALRTAITSVLASFGLEIDGSEAYDPNGGVSIDIPEIVEAVKAVVANSPDVLEHKSTVDTLAGQITRFLDIQAQQLNHLAALRAAAAALEAKLSILNMDARYSSVFAIAQLHGLEYNGPHYREELAALRRTLGVIRPPGI